MSERRSSVLIPAVSGGVAGGVGGAVASSQNLVLWQSVLLAVVVGLVVSSILAFVLKRS